MIDKSNIIPRFVSLFFKVHTPKRHCCTPTLASPPSSCWSVYFIQIFPQPLVLPLLNVNWYFTFTLCNYLVNHIKWAFKHWQSNKHTSLLWLYRPFFHKAEKMDEKAAGTTGTDGNIVLFTIQARFKRSQRSITTCYFFVIMPFIVFIEILRTYCIPGFHVNRAGTYACMTGLLT